MAAGVPLARADGLHLVCSTPWAEEIAALLTSRENSFIPESPRWLIGKDRSEEAFNILAKYHGEGDPESEFVKAEFAQMQTTVQIELEHSKRSYMDLVRTAGMRRRMLISCFLGLFTQWSGNTLISYYLSDLLSMIGKNDSLFKQQFNVASACWNLICGATVSMLVRRFRRRHMYLTCTCALLTVYICWTISMAYAVKGKESGVPNEAANTAVMFWIFAYAPCYNIGYNALTYSMFPRAYAGGEGECFADRVPQPSWWRSGPTPSGRAVSPSSSSSAAWPASSTRSSTPSASRTSAGGTSSRTAASWPLRSPSSTSSSPRRTTARSRSWPSVSRLGMSETVGTC